MATIQPGKHTVPEPWNPAKMQHIPRSDDVPRMIKNSDGSMSYPPITDNPAEFIPAHSEQVGGEVLCNGGRISVKLGKAADNRIKRPRHTEQADWNYRESTDPAVQDGPMAHLKCMSCNSERDVPVASLGDTAPACETRGCNQAMCLEIPPQPAYIPATPGLANPARINASGMALHD